MSYSVENAKVVLVGESEQITDTFKKRLLVVEKENGQYTDLYAVEFGNDRCALLDNIAVGATVTVHFNLSSREWQGKYFTSMRGWKVDVIQQGVSNQTAVPIQQPLNAPTPQTAQTVESNVPSQEAQQDNLPF